MRTRAGVGWIGDRLGSLRAAWPLDRLSPLARRRLLAALIVGLLVALLWLALALAAPCGWPGAGDCPPSDDAIALVPGDALAYVHVDTDADGEQRIAVAQLGRGLPQLGGLLIGAARSALGPGAELLTSPPPWVGGEAAVALLAGPRGGDRLTLIAADDAAGASAYAARRTGAAGEARSSAPGELVPGRHGQAYALRDGFLLLGDRAAVEEALASAPETSLEAAVAESAPLRELPEARLAYAYLSGAGARELLSGASAGPLGSLLGVRASNGIAAAITAGEGVATLTLRGALEPGAARRGAGSLSGLPAFTPRLPAELGAGTLAYLGLSDPATGIGDLIDRAESGDPELGRALKRIGRGLRAAAGVDLRHDLLPLLGGEVALSVAPSAGGDEDSTGSVALGAPYASLLADGVEAEAARSMKRLERPLERALTGSARFQTLQIAGAEARALQVSPAIDLTWAAYDDRLVVATDPAGVEAARAGGTGLAETPGFGAATAGLPQAPACLVYLNLDGLRALLEGAGLAEDPAYAAVAGELRALRGAALAISGDERSIGIDLRLLAGGS